MLLSYAALLYSLFCIVCLRNTTFVFSAILTLPLTILTGYRAVRTLPLAVSWIMHYLWLYWPAIMLIRTLPLAVLRLIHCLWLYWLTIMLMSTLPLAVLRLIHFLWLYWPAVILIRTLPLAVLPCTIICVNVGVLLLQITNTACAVCDLLLLHIVHCL